MPVSRRRVPKAKSKKPKAKPFMSFEEFMNLLNDCGYTSDAEGQAKFMADMEAVSETKSIASAPEGILRLAAAIALS